jgi:hypothetical protein
MVERELPGGAAKTSRKTIYILGVLAEIRTKNILIKGPERYRHTRLVGNWCL